VLYSFDTTNSDIISPQGPVGFDSSGNLYGTTPTGGDLNCESGYGCGVVFELAAPSEKDGPWSYATIYESKAAVTELTPKVAWFSTQGNLYSTTVVGGQGQAGTAFQLSPSTPASAAWTETVLHWFPDNKKDGYDPVGGLTWGKWGDLYGVTWLGGGTGCQGYGCGTVFEVRP